MFELRILGSPGLTRATAAGPEACAIQPKRLALLAYLAIAGRGQAHRRDTLIGLFWPELEQDRARGALRQALRYLRNALGDRVVITRGNDEIELAEGALWCDVLAFEDALQAGRLREALELYRGDLLAGFFITGAAPEFEYWLDREVGRLRTRAQEAARTLAEHAGGAGDLHQASGWALRAVELAPFDQESIQSLLLLLAEAGKFAEAIAAYQAFAQRLSSELELEPSPVLAALVETIRARQHEGRALPGIGITPSDSALPVSAQPALALTPPRQAVTPTAPVATPAPPAATPLVPIATPPAPASTSRPVSIDADWLRQFQGDHRRPLPQAWIAIAITALALLVLGGAFWSAGAHGRAGAPLMIVHPFQIAGADSTLTHLREEMIELLAARVAIFTGPATGGSALGIPVLGGRHAQGLAVGSREAVHPASFPLFPMPSGAALHLEGEVSGWLEHLIISAALTDHTHRRILAAGRVAGPLDSLPALADRVVTQLITQLAGDGTRRFDALMTAPLPALRAYLEGRRALLGGRYTEAADGFERALRHDSTNALAALGLVSAVVHLPGRDIGRGLAIATAGREQLSVPDRAFLDALSSQFAPRLAPLAHRLAAWERVVQLAPDQAESWFWLGDLHYHWGASLGLSDAHLRASAAFERALEIDPSFVAPLAHLIDLAAAHDDPASGWPLHFRNSRLGSGSDLADYLEWRLALLTGDSLALGALRTRLDRTESPNLVRILGTAQLTGTALGDAERAARVLQSRDGANSGDWFYSYLLHHYALNRGRPAEALGIAKRIQVLRPEGLLRWQLPILDAIFSDGDETAAERAATELTRLAPRLARVRGGQARQAYLGALCTTELWRLHRGERETAPQTIATLRAAPLAEPPATATATEPPATTTLRTGCASVLETLLAALGDSSASLAALEDLARQQHTGYLAWDSPHLLNLLLARLYEERGEPHQALAVLRRRPYHYIHSVPYLSSFLREEGRLAALTGDTAGAIRAYRHYLALRSEPEPRLAPKIERVRAELMPLEISRR
jgi:serine/threonine-protein kinase